MTTINDLENRITELSEKLQELKNDLENQKQQQTKPEPESLFGRWATHPEYGRGIIISKRPYDDGEVVFAWPDETFEYRSKGRFVDFADLTIDPATLTTIQDFDDAPTGTIVEDEYGVIYKKSSDSNWSGLYASNMAEVSPVHVIRWGDGK